jgi:GYF domain 2
MTSRSWYYIEAGQPKGPFGDEQMVEWFLSRRLPGNTPVWNQEMKDWVPASSLKQFTVQAPAIPPFAPVVTNGSASAAPAHLIDAANAVQAPPLPAFEQAWPRQQHSAYREARIAQPGDKLYLWDTPALARELKAGTLTQQARMKHLALVVTLYAVGINLLQFNDEAFSALKVIESLALVAAAPFGTLYCYNVNRAGDDQDFTSRYICLSVPIGIRFFWFPLSFFCRFSCFRH